MVAPVDISGRFDVGRPNQKELVLRVGDYKSGPHVMAFHFKTRLSCDVDHPASVLA